MNKMAVSSTSIEQSPALDEGMYKLRLVTISCSKSKDGKSTNMKFEYEVQGHQLPDGKPYRTNMFISEKAGWIQNDAVHALGLTMEEEKDGTLSIPGAFDGPAGEPDKWQYKGPLAGRECDAYLVRDNSSGREYNNIKYFICKLANCAQRFPKIAHTKDYGRKK
jgi:hypothetical protein